MVSILLLGLAGFLNFLIHLLPAGGEFPASFDTAVSGLSGYMHIFDPLIPIDLLLSSFLLIISVELGIFAFKGLRWVVSYIPFFGGKGN